jgi:hypothetical protein
MRWTQRVEWGRAPLGLRRGAWLGSKMDCRGQPTQYNWLCATPMVAQHMLSIDIYRALLFITWTSKPWSDRANTTEPGNPCAQLSLAPPREQLDPERPRPSRESPPPPLTLTTRPRPSQGEGDSRLNHGHTGLSHARYVRQVCARWISRTTAGWSS